MTRELLLLLGVAGLARAATGVKLYPYGDDLVYGPLARLAADPSLYPGDEQLRSFENHAWIYARLWRLGAETIGVAPLFLILTLLISLAVALAFRTLARAAGVEGRWAPLALFLAVVVQEKGVGRGDYDGAFTDHFHMQGIALALCLFAFAAVLRGRAVLAGCLLGVAAIAHPALALHAAAIAGCGWLAMGAAGLRPLAVTAAVSALIALPILAPLLLEVGAGAAPDPRVITDGYLLRAAHHYVLPAGALILWALYLCAGALGARTLGAPRAVGLIAGAALIAMAAAVFHAQGLSHPLKDKLLLVHILDLTRSSAFAWVLGAVLAAAALERAEGAVRLALLAALAAIAVANFAVSPLGVAALGLAVAAGAPRPAWSAVMRRLAPAAAIAGLGAAGMTAASARPDGPYDYQEAFLDWARTEAPADALFIAPPVLSMIREYGRRGVWVDFRTVSVAQPEHVWLFRERMEAQTPGWEALPRIGGWDAAAPWSIAYGEGNDPARMAAMLRETAATHFVTFAAAGHDPQEIADAGLQIAYRGDLFVAYRSLP